MVAMTGFLVPVLSGEGASAMVGEKAKAMGITNAIIVCDKGVKGSGVVDPIEASLKQAGINVTLFDGVLPDPPDTVVDELAAIAVKNNINGFVAVGGGSSIDTAKTANVCAKFGGSIKSWFGKYANERAFPIIAIPTTAGTGSEMTYGAVITDTTAHVKSGLGGKAMFVDLAIVDPTLYVGLPLKPTLACAFDVYTHAVEAIIFPNPEPIATAMAEKAVRLVHKYLPRLIKDLKDLEARGGMAYAATLAGAAINTSLCHNSHAIGHSIGAVCHLPHGLCCAVGFPRLMKLYGEENPVATRLAAESMGLDLPEGLSPKEIGEKVSAHVAAFIKSTGLQSIKECGVTKEQLEEAVKLMPKDMAVYRQQYPYRLTEELYREIVLEAYDA